MPAAARGAIRWICTKNPFYVISAALFLIGLRISFGDPNLASDTWAMMSGLAGYTLLLAGAACLLVRFANVWDDVRTVLLLVVLMFLATSVTFDEVLVLTPVRGMICYLAGLALAVAVSEAVLRGIRLALPAGFRVPYYLVLTLFFVYPLVLRPLVDFGPHHVPLLWGLFGFGPVAGLAFLTLLPAIRRGPDYVRGNGSPWPWPFYPWSLFVFLALAVVARSFLLCWSMHLLDNDRRTQTIFGPYFLVPFGLAIAVLLLESGIAAKSRAVMAVALALPLGLVMMTFAGHRAEPVYEEFLDAFVQFFGGLPAYVALLAAIGFYAVAALRRVPWATEWLSAGLALLSIVGPTALTIYDSTAPRPAPLLALAVLQLGLGVWQRASWRCLIGAAAAAGGLTIGGEGWDVPFRGPLAFHAALLAALVLGVMFDDLFAKLLRAAGVAGVVAACLAVSFGAFDVPPWLRWSYPPALAVALIAYGALVRQQFAWLAAGVVAAVWLMTVVGQSYLALRQRVIGLDYLSVSLLFFALAVVVSLAKSGALPRLRLTRRRQTPQASE
jgi:hypothetical protein